MIKRPKEKELQPRILYPARLSFRNEGEMKNFSDKEKTNSKNSSILNWTYKKCQKIVSKWKRKGYNLEGTHTHTHSPSCLSLKLQPVLTSYSNQNNRVLTQKQKLISKEANKEPPNKACQQWLKVMSICLYAY